jgi:hypothetical protein
MNKRTHCLLYNPGVLVTTIKPLCSLDQMLDEANQNLNSNTMANMVRLNWMVTNLKDEPVQKPLLIDHTGTVQTGDTRLAAIGLNEHIMHVPCVMTAPVDQMNLDWIYVEDKNHLGELLNIDSTDILTHDDWNYSSIDWIEFAYPHTAHHMHDEQERLHMIKKYLEQNPDTVFTRDWLQTPVNWSDYSS